MAGAIDHGVPTHGAIGDPTGALASATGHAGVFGDLLPLALWVADGDGLLVEWSLAAQDLLGHTPEQMLGRDAKLALVPEENHRLADRLAGSVRTGAAVVARGGGVGRARRAGPAARARHAAEVFAGRPEVEVLHGDWRRI
ncbi:PAS domain-containing protein, partial [Streptomyces sp. NPDC059374]|uniref:PAS domain-containing protein n=1 Tax=Streptomyces sp. NPDC059374 TaxID=3346814 RepID=UPI0036BC5100